MKRSFSHINPHYLYSRLLVIVDQKINPANPWLTSKSIALLKQLLRPTDIGVEFGSGRSTIWFAKHLKQLTSFEDNKFWYSRVDALLKLYNLTDKVNYKLFEDEIEYSFQTEIFDNNSIDFCLVDGQVRDSISVRMLPKLKSGGILVIDNVNWYLPNDLSKSPYTLRENNVASEVWQEFLILTSDYRRIWTSNGVWDTCIFFKP
jgi:predicted O-methyltransferase YrrM